MKIENCLMASFYQVPQAVVAFDWKLYQDKRKAKSFVLLWRLQCKKKIYCSPPGPGPVSGISVAPVVGVDSDSVLDDGV